MTGATSGDTGVVASVDREGGTWAGGDAYGTICLTSPTGISEDFECFEDDESITGSTGGAGMLTVNGDGIAKYEGMPYPEGETGMYEGKRYCQEHLNFKIGKDRYNYTLRIED